MVIKQEPHKNIFAAFLQFKTPEQKKKNNLKYDWENGFTDKEEILGCPS